MEWSTKIGSYSGKYANLQYLLGTQKPQNVGEASYSISTASINIFDKYHKNLSFLGSLNLFYKNKPEINEYYSGFFDSSFVVDVGFLTNIVNPNTNFLTTILSIPLKNCYYTVLGYQSSNEYVGTEIYYVKELKATYQRTELSDKKKFYYYGRKESNRKEGCS